jgi:hypothetical protein
VGCEHPPSVTWQEADSMADIVEVILADHARIQRLLADIEITSGRTDDTDSSAELTGRWETLAALLEVHADAAEEIGFAALFGRTATVARDNAKAIHDDIREAVAETRLHPAGSRAWRLAVLAACAAATARRLEVMPSPRIILCWAIGGVVVLAGSVVGIGAALVARVVILAATLVLSAQLWSPPV